jgi:hypothetical protein
MDVPGTFYESDPVVVADDRGDFHMAWLAADTPADGILPPNGYPEDNMHVYYASARRGASSFGTPVHVSASDHEMTDKPWFTVTRRGTILLSYTTEFDYTNGLYGSVVARTTDGGKTWTRTLADPSGGSFTPFTCYDRERDRVYMVDDFYGIGNGDDDAARGEAQAQAQAQAQKLTRTRTLRAKAKRPQIPSQYPDGGYDSEPGVNLLWSDDDGVTWPAANTNFIPGEDMVSLTNCTARDGQVWVMDDRNVDGTVKDAIHVRRFTHGGAILASDDIISGADDGYVYWQPQIVAENGGALDVFYYAGASFSDMAGSFRLLRSTDGGKTWAAPRTLFAPLNFNMYSRHSPTWLGDYIGLSPVGQDGIDVAFARTDTANAHVGFLHMDGDAD